MIHVNGVARLDGITIEKTVRVTGNGALSFPIAQFWGSVRVINQFAIIKAITTLTNLTGIYVDSWDGTNQEDITADGAVVSGFEEGSIIFKDQDETQAITVLNSSQVRAYELLLDNKVGKPFTLLQKNGADSFIRFHMNTTDAPVDFMIEIVLLYEKLGIGSNLVFL